jgi:hypothetical protein
MFSLFGFGKRRRRSAKKGGRKPPSALLKKCRKLRVKTTVKRGSKRVYKKVSVLKKLCSRKVRLLKKKKMAMKKKSKFGRVSKSRMGGYKKRASMKKMSSMNEMMFGRVSKSRMRGYHMMPDGKMMANKSMKFGSSRRMSYKASQLPAAMMKFGSNCSASYMQPKPVMNFGRRSKKTKMSKAAAMKAFKQFYRRHCSSRMGGRFRFGSGNPPLSASMGYEFCTNANGEGGFGGVLGANSTGLFPSPCTPQNKAQARAEAGVALPKYEPPPNAAFGRRYGGRRKCYGKGKSRYCLRMKPKRKNLYYLSSRGRS